MKNPLFRSTYDIPDQLRSLRGFIWRGILPGGPARIYHFLRTFPFTQPSLVPLVIQDWTIGISMRNYIDRHFIRVQDTEESVARNHFESFEKSLGKYLSKGIVEVSFDKYKNAAANLLIAIKRKPDGDFFESVAPHIENVLKNTPSSITLKIEEFHDEHQRHLHRLFNRLSRYGDRIYIAVHEKLRDKVHIDSSVFNLVLES
jgi:hypothetical protein